MRRAAIGPRNSSRAAEQVNVLCPPIAVVAGRVEALRRVNATAPASRACVAFMGQSTSDCPLRPRLYILSVTRP